MLHSPKEKKALGNETLHSPKEKKALGNETLHSPKHEGDEILNDNSISPKTKMTSGAHDTSSYSKRHSHDIILESDMESSEEVNQVQCEDERMVSDNGYGQNQDRQMQDCSKQDEELLNQVSESNLVTNGNCLDADEAMKVENTEVNSLNKPVHKDTRTGVRNQQGVSENACTDDDELEDLQEKIAQEHSNEVTLSNKSIEKNDTLQEQDDQTSKQVAVTEAWKFK